jgi:cytochrome b561
MSRQAVARYSSIAILQHWVSVALIVTLFGLGWRMISLPLSPAKFELYAFHKSLGFVVLALSTVRLLWRVAGPVPAPVDGPVWQRRAAAAVHWTLYALLFALPLSGWLFNSFVGFPFSFLGLVDLPPLAAPEPALKENARLAHLWLGYLLLVVLAIHAAAALHHQFVKRDGALSRMLPSLSQATRRPT